MPTKKKAKPAPAKREQAKAATPIILLAHAARSRPRRAKR
jgi:hypothetical protein